MRIHLFVGLLLLVGTRAFAQVGAPLLPPVDIANERYGRTVSADQHRIAVGAPLDDAGGVHDVGAVYIYDWDGTTWQETAKLVPSDYAPSMAFGSEVLLDDDHLFAHSYNTKTTYLFEWDGVAWQETHRLAENGWRRVAAHLGIEGNFSTTEAVAGHTLVVGGGDNNTVSIFEWSASDAQWTKTQELSMYQGTYRSYGRSVAIDGERLVVSARDCMELVLYSRYSDGWKLNQKVDLGSATHCSEIVLQDDQIVLGLPLSSRDAAPHAAGSGLVIRHSGGRWSPVDTVFSLSAQEQDLLGNSVAFTGGRIILGASGDDDQGQDAGAAYVFDRRGSKWQQAAKLTASDALRDGGLHPVREFGRAVAIHGNHALVAERGGRAFFYERSTNGWVRTAVIEQERILEECVSRRPSVALTNEWAFVGFSTVGARCTGEVYVYRRRNDRWERTTTLPDPVADRQSDGFGKDVHLVANRAIVASFPDLVHVYEWHGTSWKHMGALGHPGSDFAGNFAETVAVMDGWAFVGSTRYEPHQEALVYVYERQEDAWVAADVLKPGGEGDTKVVTDGVELLAAGGEPACIYRLTDGKWQRSTTLTGAFSHNRVYSMAMSDGMAATAVEETIRIYRRNGEVWDLVHELRGDSLDTVSLSMDAEHLLVGIPDQGPMGSAYARSLAALIGTKGKTHPSVEPEALALMQNYPNPASKATTFYYYVVEAGFTKLELFDLLGRRIATIAARHQLPGWHRATFDVQHLTSGTYVCRVTNTGRVVSRRLQVVR